MRLQLALCFVWVLLPACLAPNFYRFNVSDSVVPDKVGHICTSWGPRIEESDGQKTAGSSVLVQPGEHTVKVVYTPRGERLVSLDSKEIKVSVVAGASVIICGDHQKLKKQGVLFDTTQPGAWRIWA